MPSRFLYAAAACAALLATVLVQLASAQQGAATTTSLSAAPTPAFDDEDVTLTATVEASPGGSGTPLGMVEFFEGATSLGLAPLTDTGAGVKALRAVRLAAGSHPLSAKYLGDASFDVSISAAVHLFVDRR